MTVLHITSDSMSKICPTKITLFAIVVTEGFWGSGKSLPSGPHIPTPSYDCIPKSLTLCCATITKSRNTKVAIAKW